MSRTIKSVAISTFAALGALLPLAAAHGGTVDFEPYLTLGEVYTDNLFLAPPDEDYRDGFITEIEPGFKLGYQAPRLNAKVDYSLQGLIYARNSDMNHAYSQLNANGTLEAVRKWLFIDARTIYDHQVLNPEKVGGRRNIFGGGNRVGVSATTISPYLRHDFGSVGIATLRYAYGRAFYSKNVPDTTSNTVSFLLARQPKYGALTYDLFYLDQRLETENGRHLSFKRARVGLQDHLTARTALLLNVGKENKFKRDGTIDELGATYWSVGANYKTKKDTLRVLYGHRFFGASYQLKWHHDGFDFHTDVSYQEEPTNYNRLILGREPTTALTSTLPYARLPSLRNRRVFIMKRAAAGLAFDMSRSQIRIRLHDEHRNYVRLDKTDHVVGGKLAWEFALNLHDSITPSYSYRRYEFRDGQINYYFRSQIEYKSRISRSLTMHVALRNERRDSMRGRSYRANTVIFEVTKHF